VHQFLSPDALHVQTCGSVYPLNAFVVDPFSRAAQQYMQPPVPESRFGSRQFNQSLAKLRIVLSAFVSTTRSRNVQQLAGLALACRKLLD
jgi:hypothetical protein